MHRPTTDGAVTLRSSVVATLIALLFVFLLGGSQSTPDHMPPAESTPEEVVEQSHQDGSATSPAPASAATAPLAGRTIVLDAGHGGTDPGARGVSGRTRESYNTLFVALDAKAILEQAGAQVIMTRSDDRYIPLGTRAAIANQAGADIFISIHNDWNPNASLRGVTTYYYHDRSRHLAEVMQANLASTLGSRNVGVLQRSFQVVRDTTMPAVLLELGFLSNWSDEQLLADPAYRYRAAEAIYNGVVTYFEQAS